MIRLPILAVVMAATALLAASCTTAPPTQTGKEQLHDTVERALGQLQFEDPTLQPLLKNSYGYAVFPDVGKGGVVVGGAYGRGEVYQHGILIGYCDISQGTVGAQAGGQSFTELLVFQSQGALEDFESRPFTFDANASAVALKSGAGTAAKFDRGVAVFVEPQAGLMLEAVIGGQTFTYSPLPK